MNLKDENKIVAVKILRTFNDFVWLMLWQCAYNRYPKIGWLWVRDRDQSVVCMLNVFIFHFITFRNESTIGYCDQQTGTPSPRHKHHQCHTSIQHR